MILEDLHVHTSYCDGLALPEEMVRAAIELGMKKIGFSVHSYTFFDESYCVLQNKQESYKADILNLKEKYKDKIKILCGVEQDFYSDASTAGFDYVIGSVHYVKAGDMFYAVDDSSVDFAANCEKAFSGDFYAFAKAYFQNVSLVVEKTNANIIGHFDLISKFNQDGQFFDENNARYLKPAFSALDRLLKTGKPFEVNTGAMARGYKNEPYPNATFLREIQKRGGNVILSSDSHSPDTLCYRFRETEIYLNEMGIKL